MNWAGNRGNAIAAARTYQVCAIGKQSLAGMQSNLVRSPVDAVAEPIGNVGLPVMREFDDVRCLGPEPGIVLSRDGIA